jgi:uncharacterized membrane protein
MGRADAGLLIAVFIAAFVEFVEAFTIVLAMGITRGWRSTIAGVIAALATLPLITLALGYALVTLIPESLFQLVVGALLLIFGLQWLRKAILRASGLKSLHDEEATFREEQRAAQAAGAETRFGLDWFAFVVTFKAMFLEGLEVVFIVITFGLTADAVLPAGLAAVAAFVVVTVIGVLVHRPLSRIPENTLKFAVGVLLTTFGTYWSLEGLGLFAEGRVSLAWPGGDWALPSLLLFWVALSLSLVRWLRTGGGLRSSAATEPALEGER